MTLQQAKDKVAKNHGKESWNDWAQAYAEPYGKSLPEEIQDQAAELYARSINEQKWTPIKGHETYEVSNFGFVRNNTQYLTLSKNSAGYFRVNLYINSVCHKVFLHQLVAEHFIGPRPDGMVVMHIDNNRMNNHILNLKYGTQSENLNQAIKEGRKPSIPSTRKMAKETEETIVALRKAGMKLKDISTSSKIPIRTVQKVLQRNLITAPKPEFKP